MLPSIGATLLASASFALAQQSATNLVGTWSTKSNSTFTGPGFYDPASDRMTEPAHTGISYSFTADGFYEEAYYRAVSNPTSPNCPSGIMQWQHGSYQILSNGSLILTPIAVDGRQLTSDPCNYGNSIYSKYNQSELFEKYEQYIDPYHNIPRLDLYQFNGAPLPAMYIAYNPPQMLPTTTLHPASTATGSTQATSTSSKKMRLKRKLGLFPETPKGTNTWVDADRWWWFGLGITGVGSILVLLS